MIRLILLILEIIIVSLYTVLDCIVTFVVEKFNKEWVHRHSEKFVKLIFKIAIFLAGVKTTLKGEENIEALSNEKSYFIISNHRGFCDVVRGYLLFNKPVGIVAKKSLESIPILSYWMKRINCIFLDRHDIRDGVKMVLSSIDKIKEGVSIWIFPEGTRCKSKDPTDLLEFKSGAFKIPEKTDCYILPVAFKNTEYVYENQAPFVKAADIYINIGKPYKISELSDDERLDLGKYNQEIIRKLIMEV